MDTQDQALTISNPRLLTAVYFTLMGVIATLALDIIINTLGVEKILTLSQAIFLAVIISACFGALFGKCIIYSEKPFSRHVFLWAFLMVLCGLPFYDIGLLYFLYGNHPELFTPNNVAHLTYLYLLVLGYSFILAGLWLAIIAGVAAIYLRGRVVYHILNSNLKWRKS